MMRIRLNSLLDQTLLFVKTSNNNSGQFNRALCFAVLIGYLFSWSSTAYTALVSKPGTFLPPRFHVWTAFSAPLVENQLLVVLFNVIFIFTLGKVVTPLWGDTESIIYFTIVNLSTIVVCSILYLFVYIVTGDLHYLYYVYLHGLTSYIVALSVAVKQVMPEQLVIKLPRNKKLRNRNIPLMLVTLSVILWLLRLEPSEFVLMAFSGWLSGFTYLRFYQKHNNGGPVGPGGQLVSERGDMSDAFSFATFFPKALQPAMRALSTAGFDLLVKARICRKPIRRYVMGAQPNDAAGTLASASDGLTASHRGGLSISVGSPAAAAGTTLTSTSYDEERRRNIAVKALSERLPVVSSPTAPPASYISPYSMTTSSPPQGPPPVSSSYAAPLQTYPQRWPAAAAGGASNTATFSPSVDTGVNYAARNFAVSSSSHGPTMAASSTIAGAADYSGQQQLYSQLAAAASSASAGSSSLRGSPSLTRVTAMQHSNSHGNFNNNNNTGDADGR